LIAVLSVVVGAVISHIATQRRDSRRATFEWQKMLFDKYEGAYREFLLSESEQPTRLMLIQAFDRLRAAAVIPDHVLRLFHNAESAIGTNPGSTAPVIQLYTAVRSLVLTGQMTAATQALRWRRRSEG
jgi:hypothetical protein